MKKKHKKQIKYVLIVLLIAVVIYFGQGNEYVNQGLSFIESKIIPPLTEKVEEQPGTTISSSKFIIGKIVKVSDGDTVTLEDNNGKKRRVRLNGIDCPEIGQEYGTEAAKYVKNIALNKYVNVEIIGKDQYDRILGVLHVDGVNVNEALLKNGLAWVYKYNEDERYNSLLSEARALKMNIWSNPKSIDPYTWRKQNNKSK